SRQLHLGGHDLVVQGHVEDFLAVLIPARLLAAGGGDLELPTRSWKRLDVDLEPARFVRLVRDPLAVGGELAIALFKSSPQEKEWLLFVAGDRQNPQIPARLRIHIAEQKKLSIGGPIVWRWVLIRFQQQFFGFSAARRLPVEIE